MKTTNLRIGDILVEKGYVTPDQMNQALAWQKEHRDKRVGQILMELGFVSESQVLDALASRLHLNIVDVAQLSVDLQAVGKVSREVCEKNLILPVSLQGHNMEIVTNDPLNYFALEEVRQQTGCQLEISLSEEEPLRKNHSASSKYSHYTSDLCSPLQNQKSVYQDLRCTVSSQHHASLHSKPDSRRRLSAYLLSSCAPSPLFRICPLLLLYYIVKQAEIQPEKSAFVWISHIFTNICSFFLTFTFPLV